MATNSHRNLKRWDSELSITNDDAIGSHSLMVALFSRAIKPSISKLLVRQLPFWGSRTFIEQFQLKDYPIVNCYVALHKYLHITPDQEGILSIPVGSWLPTYRKVKNSIWFSSPKLFQPYGVALFYTLVIYSHLPFTMSKAAVRRVSSISPSMKKEVEESVASAIFTDLHIMKDEPD